MITFLNFIPLRSCKLDNGTETGTSTTSLTLAMQACRAASLGSLERPAQESTAASHHHLHENLVFSSEDSCKRFENYPKSLHFNKLVFSFQ